MGDSNAKDPDHWKHRRRMAYGAMVGMFVLAGGVVLGKIDAAGADLGGALAYAFAGVVLGYVGGVVVDDVKKRLSDQTK